MFNKRLIITTSKSQSDPSNGASPAFMITCVGGGGLGEFVLGAGSSTYQIGGGGGATAIALLPKAAIAWPVQITIGAAQGTTSFGSYVAAEGATNALGGGYKKLNNPFTLDDGGSANYHGINYYPGEMRYSSSGPQNPANVKNSGVGATVSPIYSYYSGTSGQSNSGKGRSFAYLAGFGDYGSGGTVDQNGNPDIAPTNGLCIIDYYDPN